MATSNSRDFTLTKAELIADVLDHINVIPLGETIPASDFKRASRKLNLLLKAWQADEAKLWKVKEATLFSAPNTASYSLGETGTHATNSYVSTQLNGALAASATAVTVDSTTGMTAADNIGIVLSDLTVHWDTIVSVDSSTTLTLTTGVSGAASDDALVYAYTTKVPRPLTIRGMRRQDKRYSTEQPVREISRPEYFNIPNKTSTGPGSQYFYDRQLGNGTVYIFPVSNSGNNIYNFTYLEAIEDADTNGDNLDLPAEWLLALEYNLAVLLAHNYTRMLEAKELQPLAVRYLKEAMDFDNDNASLILRPTNTSYRVSPGDNNGD